MKFGPYPKYKDSGVQWLGAVPEEWDITPLKHVASLQGRLGWQGLPEWSSAFVSPPHGTVPKPLLVLRSGRPEFRELYDAGKNRNNFLRHIAGEHWDVSPCVTSSRRTK